jgi:hypothetical protein
MLRNFPQFDRTPSGDHAATPFTSELHIELPGFGSTNDSTTNLTEKLNARLSCLAAMGLIG